ncbi:hypothetical protein K7X08_024426 [Anisodus acutangulus]|uniref:Uncharacterized protein n=1 Tax=Anisodus acutangulus TaxID=402998 RepID=A0A9Q1RFY5_9SOLA|nr:hypothetical protein K7X08_024426 [Anisodus acutangulus]
MEVSTPAHGFALRIPINAPSFFLICETDIKNWKILYMQLPRKFTNFWSKRWILGWVNHQVFMDICMDGEECHLEKCELNHYNIYYMLKYELDNSAELDNRVSESKPESYEGIVKQFVDSKKLLMEGNADSEIADAISFSHDFQKRLSLDRELVDQKENQDQEMKPVSTFVVKEASCDKSSTTDSISRERSVPNSKAEHRQV